MGDSSAPQVRCDRSGSVCKRSVVALTIFLALHRRDGAYPFPVAAIRRFAAVQTGGHAAQSFVFASVAWLMTWETVEFMTADSGCSFISTYRYAPLASVVC